jgi:2-C-methyl-D-erythritol 2,4-cyclodiphosphate synthase
MENSKTLDVNFRVGYGLDFHKFKPYSFLQYFKSKVLRVKLLPIKLIPLGGVKIPFSKEVDAHSDGDVVLHALVDAILGAICHGDIGMHFNDKDSRWKGASSDIFLLHAITLLQKQCFRIVNIDITIICEEPRLANHRESIIQNVAKLCNIELSLVNVKGKTTEKMGFLGRGEGIASIVNILVTKQ